MVTTVAPEPVASASPTPAVSSAQPAGATVTLMDDLIKSYESRLKKVEDDIGRKPFLRKAEPFASFLSLIIGVAVGAYTLYDNIVTKPADERKKTSYELTRIISNITEIRQSYIKAISQSNSAQFIQDLSSVTWPQILTNLHEAKALTKEMDDSIGIPQLLVLISESMEGRDWDVAQHFINMALKQANVLPGMKSEIYRFQARMNYFSGKPYEGNQSYKNSVDELGKEKTPGMNASRAFVVGDWLLAEYHFGDCQEGNRLALNFVKLVQQTDVNDSQRAGLLASVKRGLGNDRRCAVDPALLAALP